MTSCPAPTDRLSLWRLLSRVSYLFVCLSLLSPLRAFAANNAPPISPPSRESKAPSFQEITPQLRQAVDRGLAGLAKIQAKDGSWGADQFQEHTGITALACIAFLAHGDVPGRGQYGDVVAKGIDFLLKNATPSGLIAADTSHGPMYGHGFATLCLGEAYGETNDPRLRPVLLKAVRLIVNSQNDKGGWRYYPVPMQGDISVTICQIMALRSARNAGIAVPKKTIDKAIEFVKACQNQADGGFNYMLAGGGSAFPRSAAGVAALYYAGVYKGNALTRGLNYLLQVEPTITPNGGAHYFYGNYYAVQAMYLAGGKYWAHWFPNIRQQLLSIQGANGMWNSGYGQAYPTAMSLIILQIPNRLLPIFQR